MSLRKKLFTVLWLGSVVAVLDILAAFTHAYLVRGTSPFIVLQYIASGALGPVAFDGGWLTAFCGLLFHVLIATSWSALYFFAYPHVAILHRNRLLSACGYGSFVWVMMNVIVVPMSRIPPRPFVLQNVVIGIMILITMVGVPNAFIVPRFYQKESSHVSQ